MATSINIHQYHINIHKYPSISINVDIQQYPNPNHHLLNTSRCEVPKQISRLWLLVTGGPKKLGSSPNPSPSHSSPVGSAGSRVTKVPILEDRVKLSRQNLRRAWHTCDCHVSLGHATTNAANTKVTKTVKI